MSVEEIIKKAKEAESEVLNQEVVTEELDKEAKEQLENKDEFIDKTIEMKRNSSFQKRAEGEKRKSFASYSSTKKEEEEKKEERSTPYGYGYGYGYGYQNQQIKSKNDSDKTKEKTEKIFKEASKRIENESCEDLFSRHAKTKQPKKSKTKDSFNKSLIEALLESLKTIIGNVEE